MTPEDTQSTQPQPQATASRRTFLTRSATMIGGGAAVLALGSTFGQPRSVQAAAPSDLDILNYALTLEHLEASFYVQGLRRFDAKDFQRLAALRGSGNVLRSTVYEYFVAIRDHEVTHVQTLIAVIKQLGGTPVTPCTYNFGYKNIEGFVDVAEALEDTGVMAYDGAIGKHE